MCVCVFVGRWVFVCVCVCVCVCLSLVLRASVPAAASPLAALSDSLRLRGAVEILDAWWGAPHYRTSDELDYISELVEDYVSRLEGQCILMRKGPLDPDALRQLRRSHPVLKFCLVHSRSFFPESSSNPSALLVARVCQLRALFHRLGA